VQNFARDIGHAVFYRPSVPLPDDASRAHPAHGAGRFSAALGAPENQ
jgi:hypothetical protein